MKMLIAATASLVIVTATLSHASPSDIDLSCQEGNATIVNFPLGNVPFPTGTFITDQFKRQGVVFSADSSDLPPPFVSFPSQENVIVQGGAFANLFRVNFLGDSVVRVSTTLQDFNASAQTHTLTAFDRHGNIVDTASFTETGSAPDRFTLTVSSCDGIAFVVALEQPFGFEVLHRLSFAKRTRSN